MSVFAQVWFWTLLAFLVGALLTWVLLVRPDHRRNQPSDRQVSGPAEPTGGSAGVDDRSGTQGSGAAVWPAEPAEIPAKEAEAGRPRTRWMESDSLRGLSTQVGGHAEESAPAPEYPRAPSYEQYPPGHPARAGYARQHPPEAAPPQSGQRGAPQAYAEPEYADTVPTERNYPESDAAPGESGSVSSVLDGSAEVSAADRLERTEQQSRQEGTSEGSSLESASTPGAGAQPEADDGTPLPKRQRGATNRIRGGFEPPRPIQPSVRPVARRTPQNLDAVSSGSLFEPADPSPPSSGGELAGRQPPPARSHDVAEGRPASGPFGPGSAMPLADGSRPGPGFTVKASVTALRYCTQDSPQFPRMVAEVWFAGAADAERVGFRPLT